MRLLATALLLCAQSNPAAGAKAGGDAEEAALAELRASSKLMETLLPYHDDGHTVIKYLQKRGSGRPLAAGTTMGVPLLHTPLG